MDSKPILIGCDIGGTTHGGTTHTVVEAGFALADGLRTTAMLVQVDDFGHLLSERFHAVDPPKLQEMKAAYREGALADLRRLVTRIGRDPERVEMLVREGRTYE